MTRVSVILAGLIVGLLAVACGSPKTTVVTSATQQRGITVSGHGEVEAPPDTGYFQVGVQVHASTVAAARDGAASAADAVTKALKADGIADADIKTMNYAINPEYSYTNGSQKLTGYVVTNTVEAKVRNLDNFSKILDDASAAGGNDVQIQGIRFDIADNSKLLDQARQAAVDDAKKKAQQLASLGGVTLGKPMTIAETQSSTPPPITATSKGVPAAPATGMPVPISAGSNKVTVDVSATWDLGS